MNQLTIGLCLLLVTPSFLNASSLVSPWAPSIRVTERKIIGRPAESHHSINGMNMVILDQEECEAKVLNPSSVEFSDSCQLLQGYYKYSFQAEGLSTGRDVYFEFLVSRHGAKSQTTLINSPIYLENGRAVQSPGQ